MSVFTENGVRVGDHLLYSDFAAVRCSPVDGRGMCQVRPSMCVVSEHVASGERSVYFRDCTPSFWQEFREFLR